MDLAHREEIKEIHITFSSFKFEGEGGGGGRLSNSDGKKKIEKMF